MPSLWDRFLEFKESMASRAEQRQGIGEEILKSPLSPTWLPQKAWESYKNYINPILWSATVMHSPVGSPMTSELKDGQYVPLEKPRTITEEDKRQAEGLAMTRMAELLAYRGGVAAISKAAPHLKPLYYRLARKTTGGKVPVDVIDDIWERLRMGKQLDDKQLKVFDAMMETGKKTKLGVGKLKGEAMKKGAVKLLGTKDVPRPVKGAIEYRPPYRPDMPPEPPMETGGVGAPLKPKPPSMTPAQERGLIAGKPPGAIVPTPATGETPLIEQVYSQKSYDVVAGLAGGTPQTTIGGEVGMGGLPATPPPASNTQLAVAHQIAQDLQLVSPKGKMKPQYRRLAENMTGKKSMADMTEAEAEDFINALRKLEPRVIGGEKKPPVIPTTTKLAKPEFFKREFGKPSLVKFITPSDRYAYTLGVYDLIKPAIEAKTEMEIVRGELFRWLDKQGQQIDKFEKIGLGERAIKGIKGEPTTGRVKWFNLLDKYETGYAAGLTGEQATTFNELRDLTRRMLERTNEVREHVGLDPINNIKSYVTHISDVMTKQQLREKYPFPEEIKYWLSKIKPKHIYNPTALHRMVADREGLYRDPIRALKAMTSMDLKQIYLEYPNIIFREQMSALRKDIPADTRHWVEAYMNEVIKGYPTKLDNLTNATLNKMGITQMMDILMKPFGRTMGMNPAKQMYGKIGRLVHDATIWARPKLVIRNHTQKLLTMGLYDESAFVKAMLPANKELKYLVENSPFHKISKREFLEVLPQGVLGKIEQLGFVPYGHSHLSNVDFSMKAAYHAARDLVNNPKYAKLGWTMDDVAKEMEYGANTTQYWYNLMGMPELYRSGATRAIFTLQSWWQNYTMKYWREMLHRAFTGKTGWGKEIPTKWRVGALRHVIYSLMFIEGTRRGLGLDYKRTALLGTLPIWLSPPAQITTALYKYITAQNDSQRKQALYQIKNSYKAFIPGSMAWRDWQKAYGAYPERGVIGAAKELLTYPAKTKETGGIQRKESSLWERYQQRQYK